jgi:DNA-binding IclR family transcriptional regulator
VAASTRTVDRALELLAAVAEHHPGSSLAELARATELSHATALRLLRTLAQQGFVRRDADGTYRAGAQLIQLAATALRGDPVYELAGPHLHALAAETQETANLGVAIEGGRALYLRQVSSPRLVRTASWTGRTIPLRGTAMGAALRGDVGERGYVSTAASVEPDVTAVAAPVHGPGGEIVAALSVIAPTYRTSEADARRIGAALVAHARALSHELGAGVETEAA